MRRSIEPARLRHLLLLAVSACDAPTAVEVFLDYSEAVRAARIDASVETEALPRSDVSDLPSDGAGSVVLLLPDRFGGQALVLSIDGLTVTGEIGARWSGSVDLVTGEVVSVQASLHPRCGDGIERAPETCDDGNEDNGDGCSTLCSIEAPPPGCGDGRIEPPEICDDGARDGDDGCSPLCSIEGGWSCGGEPSACTRAEEEISVCFGVPMRCEPSTALVLVDASGPSCPAGPGRGTAGDPFCSLASAVSGRSTGTIVLAPGVYAGAIDIRGQDLVIASSGAASIVSGGEHVLTIGVGGSVSIEGIVISGGGIRAEAGRLSLIASNVGPSPQIGIEAKDSELAVERSRIGGNAKGGVSLDGGLHRIASSVIAGNGGDNTQLGGLRIVRTDSGSLFLNNTIAGNRAKDDRTAGVRCMSAAVIWNSIVWNNVGGNELGVDSVCVPQSSDLAGPYEGPGLGNISVDPLFLDPELHLAAGSPCIDAGDTARAPMFDIDGDARPQGLGVDIGADEVP